MAATTNGRTDVTPEERVQEVFARVRAKDPRVADLYAPDATLTSSGPSREGRDAIREFYEGVFRGGGVQPRVQELYSSPPIVIAVLRVGTPSGEEHRVADVFDVGDEGIRSMRACMLT
jgi:hypothetical protein